MNKIPIVTFALLFAGCFASRQVSHQDLQSKDRDFHLLSVERTDGTLLDFSHDPPGYAILTDTVITRTTADRTKEVIYLSEVDIKTAYRRYSGGEKAVGLVVFVGGGVAITSLAYYIFRTPF